LHPAPQGDIKPETEQNEANPSLTTSIPKRAMFYFISQSLFKLMPTALTIKHRSGAWKSGRFGKDINNRVLDSWGPRCLHSVKVENSFLLVCGVCFVEQTK